MTLKPYYPPTRNFQIRENSALLGKQEGWKPSLPSTYILHHSGPALHPRLVHSPATFSTFLSCVGVPHVPPEPRGRFFQATSNVWPLARVLPTTRKVPAPTHVATSPLAEPTASLRAPTLGCSPPRGNLHLHQMFLPDPERDRRDKATSYLVRQRVFSKAEQMVHME